MSLPNDHGILDPIPEEHLRDALRAKTPEERIAAAEAGLAFPQEDLEADTQVFLLRQLYTGHMELRQYADAIHVCTVMSSIGPLSDIAYHDRSRAEIAIGDLEAAIGSARLAARRAEADRKSFMYWSLATIQHWAGKEDDALETLDKGLRFAVKDRTLLKGHTCYIQLSMGLIPEELEMTRAALRRSPAAQGYGAFVLGMIAYHLGDEKEAAAQLRAFIRRNARLDFMKAITLQEELRRARLALAELESS